MNYRWITLVIVGQLLNYSQTELINDDWLDPLSMDQAYLTIRNANCSDSIRLMYNLVVCEQCDFEILGVPVSDNSSQTIIINTKYAYDFNVLSDTTNDRSHCQINSHKFAEYGSYLFEVGQTTNDQNGCTIIQTKESGYYWLPVIVGLAGLLLIIVVVQLWHQISHNQRFSRLLPKAAQQRLINNDLVLSLPRNPINILHDGTDDIISTLATGSELPLVRSSNSELVKKVVPKRLRSLDAFRGFSLMVMIFVNYGGGGYWFFKHSIWNGLTVADVVFPWFTWMMGVSIVLSQRSLRAKNVRKRTIFLKICRRTFLLFLLGLILQGGYERWVYIRIFGVLQRLAACYFFAAIIVLVFDDAEDEPYSAQWSRDGDVHQPLRSELSNTLFHFWPQWLIVSLITAAWVLITLLWKFSADCPRGYLGPGGKHEHGKYQNCTGGVAGYIDRLILRSSHMDNNPTCKDIYDTHLPHDPEGLLGILTGILLCYLGVQAGHSFAHSTRNLRVCAHWLLFGLLCGSIGLALAKGGQSDSWIPINKNLWSLSFVLILAGSAFILLTILYLLIDVFQWFTGAPFLWLGMNSIVVYVGHEIGSKTFPIQFQVEKTTHAQLMAMHLYGVMLWTVVAGLLYRKKVFVAI